MSENNDIINNDIINNISDAGTNKEKISENAESAAPFSSVIFESIDEEVLSAAIDDEFGTETTASKEIVSESEEEAASETDIADISDEPAADETASPEHAKNRRLVPAIITGTLAILSLLAIVICSNMFVFIDGEITPTNVTRLDLRGRDISSVYSLTRCKKLEYLDLRENHITTKEYAILRDALGDCEILWDATVAGMLFPSDLTELTICPESENDFIALSGFSKLEWLNLSGCTMYDEILKLRKQLPNCDIYWTVEICGISVPCTTSVLSIPNLTEDDADSVASLVKYLPELTAVSINKSQMSNSDTAALADALSPLEVVWPVELGGFTAPSNSTEVAANSRVIDLSKLCEAIPYMPDLTKVTLINCGLPVQELIDADEKFSNVSFDWDIQLFGKTFMRLDELIDISGIKLADYDLNDMDAVIAQMPNLKKIDMCKCGLTDNEMISLCHKYPQLKLVWIIRFGRWSVRTDATVFSTYQPNNPKTRLTDADAAKLANCTDLIALDLGHNALYDISWISSLTNLKILILSDNDIRDVSPLASLKNLEYLEIFSNWITDISPLAELTNLVDLNLCHSFIRDASPLYGLQKLDRLWISMGNLDKQDYEALEEALPNCTFNFYYSSPIAQGWRKHERYYEMAYLFQYEGYETKKE